METPLKADAFAMEDSAKIAIIQEHFEKIMDTLGLDLEDDSLKGTPKRVAKMFVQEIFQANIQHFGDQPHRPEWRDLRG